MRGECRPGKGSHQGEGGGRGGCMKFEYRVLMHVYMSACLYVLYVRTVGAQVSKQYRNRGVL